VDVISGVTRGLIQGGNSAEGESLGVHYQTLRKNLRTIGCLCQNPMSPEITSVSSSFERIGLIHRLAALDLRAGVEQSFDCLVI